MHNWLTNWNEGKGDKLHNFQELDTPVKARRYFGVNGTTTTK